MAFQTPPAPFSLPAQHPQTQHVGSRGLTRHKANASVQSPNADLGAIPKTPTRALNKAPHLPSTGPAPALTPPHTISVPTCPGAAALSGTAAACLFLLSTSTIPATGSSDRAPHHLRYRGGSNSPVTRGQAACRLLTACPCSPAASAGHPAPLTRADRCRLCRQRSTCCLYGISVQSHGFLLFFFSASNFFSDMLSEVPPNPLGPAQRGGQQTALPSQPPASYWVHRNHILGPPGSHTSVFFPLSSPFFAVVFYLSSRK